MPITFISYRREDSAGYAGRLHESLERRLGEGQVFRDVDTLDPGQDFVDAIERRLHECRVFIAVIGREWIDARSASGARRLDQENDYVRLEIAAALARPDVLLIPVLVENASMPAPEQLPDVVRPLARRHAMTIHDETWDEDVDRLAATMRRADTHSRHVDFSRHIGPPGTSRRRTVIAAAVLLVLLAGTTYFLQSRSTGSSDPNRSTSSNTDNDPNSPPAATFAAYALTIPRVAEVAVRDVAYSVVSASVGPRGRDRTLRVRLRVSNEGFVDVNVAERFVRVVYGSETAGPVSELNELLPSRSLRYYVVDFAVPANVEEVRLRIGDDAKYVGEIPLDVRPTGRPAQDDSDPEDLSRAILIRALGDETPLVTSGDVRVTVRRVITRRFSNLVRVVADVRLTNNGRFPIDTGAATLRLAAGDELLAPVREPNEVIAAGGTLSGDYVFEVGPSVAMATLRASTSDTSGEVAFNISR